VHVNVETKTALLKGYSHSGQMAKAESLFESMCTAQGKSVPQVNRKSVEAFSQPSVHIHIAYSKK
jgi:pentatricopeptide repeat protein